MKLKSFLSFCLGLFLSNVLSAQEKLYNEVQDKYVLTAAGASHLAKLPLKCMQQEFPYKTGVTFSDTTLITKPKNYHPAFYGCFDWHSSVHGHWMLVRLLKLFPKLPEMTEIRTKLRSNLSATNIQTEVELFKQEAHRGFERTYGWAWLLQLRKELLSWDDPLGKELSKNLAPLAQQLVRLYIDYLPKMNYPIRVGEHSNLAFGLTLAYDYGMETKNDSLLHVIQETALRFYKNDVGCPISWEPGGSDFLSPCLEEADLMWRILPKKDYASWVEQFLPDIFNGQTVLAPGTVTDRTDGKLVHLDGLNLSRAWCLYGIAHHIPAHKTVLINLANKHLAAALPHVASGDYMGEHWLASFAVYALTMQ